MVYSNDGILYSITKKLKYAIVHQNIWLTWVKGIKKWENESVFWHACNVLLLI